MSGELQNRRFCSIKEDNLTPIYPFIFKEKTMEIAEHLIKNNIFCVGIRYPTVPKGLERIRVSINVGHKKEDFELAKQIYQMYLDTILYDPESGKYDFGKLGKATKSERDKMDKLLEIIKEISESRTDNLAPQTEIEEKAKELLGIDEEEVDRLLNKLKREGEIFDPRPAMWGLT